MIYLFLTSQNRSDQSDQFVQLKIELFLIWITIADDMFLCMFINEYVNFINIFYITIQNIELLNQ